LLAETYRRDNSDLEAFFELGQAEFYIGTVYKELGVLEMAEVSIMAYAEITRQLIVLQPENADWVLEMAFALSNLGSLQIERDANKPERALQLLQSALEYNQIALVLDPKNSYYQSELGQSHAFVADAQREVCDLEGAEQSRMKQVSLEQELWSADREDTRRMKYLAFAYSGYGVVQEKMGHVDVAIENLAKALLLMEPVMLENPESKSISLWMLDRSHHLIVLKAHGENTDHAWMAMDELDQEWQNFYHAYEAQDEDTRNYVSFLLNRAVLARSMDAPELAAELIEDAREKIGRLLDKLPGDRYAGNLMMEVVFQAWVLNQELPTESVLAQLPDYMSNDGHTRACEDASLAVKQAVMLGDMDRASDLTTYLMDNGYTEVGFMHFCKAYSLCQGQ